MASADQLSENKVEHPNQEEKVVDVTTPIIVDLGKQRPKRLKALKRGQGKLMSEVADVLEEVVVNLGDEVAGKTLVPVILVYEKKKKGKRRYRMFNF